ncbi:MAG: flavodoxin domain-containing protein [Desulfobacterota bacterium]|nr:flavodoxin domain-containing protein [Thermodesulfobacteriota bacterium]
MKRVYTRIAVGYIALVLLFLSPRYAGAETKKGLLVYDSIYSSTVEVAYWIKAIIGNEQPLDVKKIDQVITVKPYDYVIIGSYSKWEKPSPRIYKFVEQHAAELAKKQVCYFLTCGDMDETQILKAPGKEAHLIAGRNYLYDIMQKHPEIKPVVIGGFGGRQVMPALQGTDKFMTWMLEKLAKEGAPWVGLDIWESLDPARVEAFGNEVRVKVLGLEPLADVQKYRGFWNSLQPASLSDPSKVKYTPRPYTVHHSTEKIFYTRSRIKASLDDTIRMIQQWAQQEGFSLKEQRKTFFNTYYHAVKTIDGKERIIHIVVADLTEDPGNTHISFRSFDKPDVRKPLEDAIAKAEQLLWADGRKIEGR